MSADLIILIADDQPEFVETLIRFLGRAFLKEMPHMSVGYLKAGNMADALVLAPQANATILDGELPDSTAAETVLRINDFPKPVIFLTGHDDPVLLAKAKRHGAADAFLKENLDGLFKQIIGCFLLSLMVPDER